MNELHDLNFISLFKSYMYPNGKRRHLFSFWEHIFALLIVGLVCWYCHGINDLDKLMISLGNNIFAASATVLSIVIAGFAVFAAVSDEKFSVFLFMNDAWLGISFPFWPASVMWSLNLLTSGAMILSSYRVLTERIYLILLGFSIWLFVLSLEFTISLFGIVLRTTYLRSKYYHSLSETKDH